MIHSFNQKNDVYGMIMFSIFLIIFLLMALCYFYNKGKYRIIIELYEKEIGPLPITAILSKNASLFTTPSLYLAKISFITETLILPYNRVSNHGMTKEGYLFIRGLPNRLTIGFKVEACLWLMNVLLGVYLFIIR